MTKEQAEIRLKRMMKAIYKPVEGKRIMKDGRTFILRKGEKPVNGWKLV